MSAYKKIQCNIVDKDTLIQALADLNLKVSVYDEAQALVGYEGKARANTAEIVVHRKTLNQAFTGASNDLGFKWDETTKEYMMICSDYDLNLNIDQRIKQAYAKIAIEKAMKAHGFKVKINTPVEQIRQRAKRVKVSITGQKLV